MNKKKWQIIAVLNLIACFTIMMVLFQSLHFQNYYQHQIFYAAVILGSGLLMLIMPYQSLHQKDLDNKAKLWCTLGGPFWLCCSVALWWILSQISALGGVPEKTVHWLYPVALLASIILIFWQQTKIQKMYGARPANVTYDRKQGLLDGQNYFELKQYQKAVDEYTIGVDRDPSDGEMYYLRAKAYEKLQLNDLAEKDKKLSEKFGYSPATKE